MSSSDVNPLPSIGLYGQSWQTILTNIVPTKEDELKLKSCFDKIKRILTDECKLVKKYSQDFTNIKTTLYSVQAIVDNINIDILPAMEMDDPTRFIMKMKDNPNVQRYLSACASLAQKNFIDAQSNRYKEMVRLVKYWKSKQQWTPVGTAPISYLLELLMLDVYNRYAHLETDTSVHDGLFQRFLDLVIKLLPQTRITFNMFYHETIAISYYPKTSDTIPDVQSPSAQIGPFQLRIGADIETVDNRKYWHVYLFVEHVHQDWLEFKNNIIGVSKNIRFDFKLQISQERNRSYEPISKQWTTLPTTGQKVYLTTKEEKLKCNYAQQSFDISEYYHSDNTDIQCEITLVLFP